MTVHGGQEMSSRNARQPRPLSGALASECAGLLIGEKLLNFAEAAERYTEFAQELPKFLRAIRDVFIVQELASTLYSLNAQRGSARFSVVLFGRFPQFRSLFSKAGRQKRLRLN
jgi:hypothetical protein